MRARDVEAFLENCGPADYDQGAVSPATYHLQIGEKGNYNCIAFAAGDTERWWWPDQRFPDDRYWPPHLPREPEGRETMRNFIRAFESLGYFQCKDGSLESGIEKVAIFAKGSPTHAARQLESGSWVSKVGNLEDIVHFKLDSVEGIEYGSVKVFMARMRDGAPMPRKTIMDKIRSFFRLP